jgi:hypothetical protein
MRVSSRLTCSNIHFLISTNIKVYVMALTKADISCGEIQTEMIRTYVLKRFRKTSGYTANKNLRLIRALFNFTMHS